MPLLVQNRYKILWFRWSEVLIIVQPETVVGWHRAGFRLFWRWRSRAAKFGRPTTTPGIRQLIRRIAQENPGWGAPKIHGELLKLGLELSERTVSRYLARLFFKRERSETLVGVLEEPPGGHHWVGLLHGSNIDVPLYILRFRDRAQSPADSALQRHRSSDGRLGGPTTPGDFHGQRRVSVHDPRS
jgi:hypothetical protein